MNNNFTLNVPINPTSFGQIGIMLLRECYEQGLEPNIAPITDPQLQHEKTDGKFLAWINSCSRKFNSNHTRSTPTLRLWHINQSMEFISECQTLLTFHELDQLTDSEINILNQQNQIAVTSKASQDLFQDHIDKTVKFINLPFDHYNFNEVERRGTGDDRIVFNLVGKYEPLRKRHNKVIKTWLDEFGDNPKYELRCAIANHFYEEREYKEALRQVIGKNYHNLNFLGWFVQNSLYNDYLNNGDIVIGMGNESWGLPEFNSIALGKHGVIMDCLGHKEWATGKNSHLVEPSGMIPADNDKFFKKGYEFNQGNFYDFNETDFIAQCYQAIESYNKNPINETGIELQKFTTKQFLEDTQNMLK